MSVVAPEIDIYVDDALIDEDSHGGSERVTSSRIGDGLVCGNIAERVKSWRIQAQSFELANFISVSFPMFKGLVTHHYRQDFLAFWKDLVVIPFGNIMVKGLQLLSDPFLPLRLNGEKSYGICHSICCSIKPSSSKEEQISPDLRFAQRKSG